MCISDNMLHVSYDYVFSLCFSQVRRMERHQGYYQSEYQSTLRNSQNIIDKHQRSRKIDGNEGTAKIASIYVFDCLLF